ncbi:MAG: hypothetical protein HZB15_02195 [Actinobacteria bacterium]|nr:hypothetical protein [Actinomycetota bacterium]
MATKPPLSATAKRLAAAKRATMAESHSPSEMAALDLIAERNDLEPSVRTIMAADLTEEGRAYGLELFRTSLSVPGDQNRLPVNTIAAARKKHGVRPA